MLVIKFSNASKLTIPMIRPEHLWFYMRSANGRRRYIVTSSLIDWVNADSRYSSLFAGCWYPGDAKSQVVSSFLCWPYRVTGILSSISSTGKDFNVLNNLGVKNSRKCKLYRANEYGETTLCYCVAKICRHELLWMTYVKATSMGKVDNFTHLKIWIQQYIKNATNYSPFCNSVGNNKGAC